MTMFLQPHPFAEAVRVESVFFLIQEHPELTEYRLISILKTPPELSDAFV